MLNQCFLLHFYANWEELRPLVTSRAYSIKEGFNPCVIEKQFMRWYALLQHRTLSALARVSLATHGLLRVDQLIRRGVFTICA